jgi:SWI/SNF-related matrix-associated actin-dependent regulator 1 of chromatin subfamily A
MIEGKKSDDFTTDFVVVNYEKLGKKEGKRVKANENLKKDWNVVVADESHYVQNPKSIRSKALSQILKPVDFRFFLTGTAATVRPVNVYNQFSLLGREDVVGSWKRFVERYCGAHKTQYGLDTNGATNLGELNLKLRTSCYIRRDKRDVLKDLPDIQTTILDVEIDNRKEYKQAEEEFTQFLKDNYSKSQMMTKLKAEVIVQLGILKRVAAIGKMKTTLEWIDDVLATENKLVVFTQTNVIIDMICDRYKCNKINGSVNIKKRQEYLEDFIQNEDTWILPINIKAGGTGIDGLQEVCSNVLFTEWSDIPAEEDQAISRIERSGQKNKINVYKTLAKNTIEELLQEELVNKKVITDAINKGSSVSVENNLIDNILTHYI